MNTLKYALSMAAFMTAAVHANETKETSRDTKKEVPCSCASYAKQIASLLPSAQRVKKTTATVIKETYPYIGLFAFFTWINPYLKSLKIASPATAPAPTAQSSNTENATNASNTANTEPSNQTAKPIARFCPTTLNNGFQETLGEVLKLVTSAFALRKIKLQFEKIDDTLTAYFDVNDEPQDATKAVKTA